MEKEKGSRGWMEYIMERGLWLSFALLGSLVMQNTLVAMMNNTYDRIEEESLVSACGDDLNRGLPDCLDETHSNHAQGQLIVIALTNLCLACSS